jgi:hypothetical protein
MCSLRSRQTIAQIVKLPFELYGLFALGYDLDLVEFGPELAGDIQPIAGAIVGDAIEYIGV